MFTTRHKSARLLTAAAAALAALTVATPFAHAAAGEAQACITRGDLTLEGIHRSPFAGWVSVVDAQGVAWLEPASLYPSGMPDCAPSVPFGTADGTPSSGIAPTLTSPYPGWTVVVDEVGVPWLVPVAQAH